MATVDATAITRIHDVEGSLTLTSIGGGAGGAANSEIVIQAAQSAGRKQSNAADHGFWLTVGSQNVSAAGVHVGVWVNHIHYGVLTQLRVRLGSAIGSATAGNWDGHNFPLAQYPALGGWVRHWIDVARTPDFQGDSGGLVKTALIGVAVVAWLPAVSGNAPNIIMDASDFTTTGLLLTGTAGVWQDFITADEGTGGNKYGVVVTTAGVIFVLARLILGSASSLAFADSGFVIVFPQQATVAANFMGLTVDLQHASTAITWANGVVKSAGTVQGDLVVTGNAGSLAVESTTLSALRVVTLTAGATLTECLVAGCGLITAGGGALLDCSVIDATGTAALLWDTATDPNGKLDGTAFTSGGSGHAIQFGPNTPGDPTEISLSGVTFSGYGAADTTDAAIYNNSGKHLIINIIGGGTTPTVLNGSGASTTIVSGQTAVTFTGMKDNTEVRVYDAGTGEEIAGIEDATDGSPGNRSFTWSDAASNVVDYVIHNVDYESIRVEGYVVPASDASIPIQQRLDRNYENT